MISRPLALALALSSALTTAATLSADGCGPDKSCTVTSPLAPPPLGDPIGGGLPGFESPYLGHTGSWDGKGGGVGGSSKVPDLDLEVEMGLRWTFMPVYWAKLEPSGPVDLGAGVPAPWRSLDAFVVEAQARGLNVLLQAPVLGGNADQPPAWAGLREEGKSAPLDMAAAAAFAGKLAERYRPGGTLARAQGWGDAYGVRAWELDNEPEAYRVHWDGQPGDYAEFVTGVSAAIKAADPQAVILTPAVAASADHPWVEEALDAYALVGSPIYQAAGIPHSVGPSADVVSFHVYEGLNDQAVECAMGVVREAFEAYEGVRGFEYAPKGRFWHTEGNYDFFGSAPEEVRARWRWQHFTRGFWAGAHKLMVMDAQAPLETLSVKTYVEILPDPFPMAEASGAALLIEGDAAVYRHVDRAGPGAGEGRVWILWAEAGGAGATVELPTRGASVTRVTPDGVRETLASAGGTVRVALEADSELSPPVMIVDR